VLARHPGERGKSFEAHSLRIVLAVDESIRTRRAVEL
jgi:hypothetical protein